MVVPRPFDPVYIFDLSHTSPYIGLLLQNGQNVIFEYLSIQETEIGHSLNINAKLQIDVLKTQFLIIIILFFIEFLQGCNSFQMRGEWHTPLLSLVLEIK